MPQQPATRNTTTPNGARGAGGAGGVGAGGAGGEEGATAQGSTTDHDWEDKELSSEDVEMDFVGTHAPRADIGTLEPDSDDEESTRMLAHMGCSTNHRRRKPPRSLRQATPKEAIVSEIYSPSRITQLLREMRSRRSKRARHLMPGFAFDLTTDPDDGLPWEFSTESEG